MESFLKKLPYLLCFVFLVGSLSAVPLELLTREDTWKSSFVPPRATRENLLESIDKARTYFLNHQTSDGNFIYQLELVTGDITEQDNQVRQAGGLWGLSSLNRDFPMEQTRIAVFKGVNFFAQHLAALPNGMRCFTYPGDSTIKTGSVALFCLALIEFLRTDDPSVSDTLKADFYRLLDMHIDFLRSMELASGGWAKEYDLTTGERSEEASPYYDGETLLAYCKAARYLGYEKLRPRIDQSIPALVRQYVENCLDADSSKNLTKGFFQWGCMSFDEYFGAGWTTNRELVEKAALALAWWSIYKNDLIRRQGNTGYAIEGLVSVWKIATATGREAEANSLASVIHTVMSTLMSWQYKGPFMKYNQMFYALPIAAKDAEGGITDSGTSTTIRIDTVQHQLHAMLLMLKYMY